jgi:predicted dehydrogenase
MASQAPSAFTRRSFARLATAGALSSRLLTAQEGRKIGYCIIGLGRISMQHFMPGVKASEHCRITGLVSGHRDKAEKMAAEYGVPAKSIYDYKNMDAIADNKDIDAVYVALPNSMHAEYSIRSAKAGKHVLSEKPMATTVADAQAMIDACRKAGKKLMIAYRCQFEPTNLRAIKMIREGKLGVVQAIESANGFNIKPGEWRLDGKLAGGGPLMDVGVYSLNACRYLTGEEPIDLKADCSVIDKDGRFKDVEENMSWTMRFPSGIVATCNTSYGVAMPGFYRVHGTKGMMHVEPSFPYQGLRFTARIQGEPPIDEPTDDPEPNQFKREADHFADCILNNKESRANGEEGLKDLKLMTSLYRSCGR